MSDYSGEPSGEYDDFTEAPREPYDWAKEDDDPDDAA